ncbi:MAG TPA: hypothetical protein VFN13_04820 [Rudaea sp.]|nr:hypothetical protein [Rudaea sp.]
MRTEKAAKDTINSTADKLHDGIEVADDKLDKAVDAVGARLASLESWLRDHGEQLVAGAKDVSKSARQHATSHPLAAFGIAFVAGVTVARLFRR